MIIHENIKKYRIQSSITQEDLARALNIGQSSIAMWESGENTPRADKLPDLAKALGCTIDELYREEQ